MAKATAEELEYLISRLRENLGIAFTRNNSDKGSNGSRSFKNSFNDEIPDDFDLIQQQELNTSSDQQTSSTPNNSRQNFGASYFANKFLNVEDNDQLLSTLFTVAESLLKNFRKQQSRLATTKNTIEQQNQIIYEYESEITKLKLRNEEEQEVMIQFEQDYTIARNDNQGYLEEIKSLKKQIKAATKEKQDVESSLNQVIANQQEMINNLKSEGQQQRSKLKESKIEIEATNHRIDDIQQQNENMKKQMNDLKYQNKNLQLEVQSFQQQEEDLLRREKEVWIKMQQPQVLQSVKPSSTNHSTTNTPNNFYSTQQVQNRKEQLFNESGSSKKKKPPMNFNLMLNFDKLEGFETPNPSGRSNQRQQIHFNDNKKTLANELNIEVFDEFLNNDDHFNIADNFNGDYSPKSQNYRESSPNASQLSLRASELDMKSEKNTSANKKKIVKVRQSQKRTATNHQYLALTMTKEEYNAFLKSKYGDTPLGKDYLQGLRNSPHKVNMDTRINVQAYKQRREQEQLREQSHQSIQISSGNSSPESQPSDKEDDHSPTKLDLIKVNGRSLLERTQKAAGQLAKKNGECVVF